MKEDEDRHQRELIIVGLCMTGAFSSVSLSYSRPPESMFISAGVSRGICNLKHLLCMFHCYFGM